MAGLLSIATARPALFSLQETDDGS